MKSLSVAVSALEHALGPGSSHMFRSTWGLMLEASQILAYGSDGRMHPRSTGETIRIKRQAGEPSYEMRLSDARVSWAMRLLSAVGEADWRARAVLEVYHGDVGARWARPLEVDKDAVARLGQASDREWAVYPLTGAGRAIVKAAREKHALSREIRDDELCAQDIALQFANPNDIRRARHAAMRTEARTMIGAAWELLTAAADAHPQIESRWLDV